MSPADEDIQHLPKICPNSEDRIGNPEAGSGLAAEAGRAENSVGESTPTPRDEADLHWLYRRSSLPILWGVQLLILVLAVLPDLFIHHHAHFPDSGFTLDADFGFFAWYGFATCAAMVVAAKILGIFLKRKDSYYDD